MLNRMPWMCSLVLASTMAACDGSATTSTTKEDTAPMIWGGQVSELGYFVVDYEKTTRGEVYVRSVNSDSTECLDGIVRASCRMDEVSFASAGLPEEEALDFENELLAGYGVVQGWMELVPPRRGEEGYTQVFQVLEAWRSATFVHADEIPMYHVALNGIVCMRAPCPSMTASILNTEQSIFIDTLNLTAADAEEKDTSSGYEALAGSGVLVAGSIEEPTAMDATMSGDVDATAPVISPEGRTLHAAVFFLRM